MENWVVTGATATSSVTAVGPVAVSLKITGPSPSAKVTVAPGPLNESSQLAAVVFQAALAPPCHRRTGTLDTSRSIWLAAALLTSVACIPAGRVPSVNE